ncbi:MAG TPA: Gfo/Idh/MocA family oxidoreductase, partial [Lentisphaeria bacterium]|nr:Gfo/Idh/MocA family oxidoreductase [Lentisphaeria bacterium]
MSGIFDTDQRIRLGIWGLGRGSNFIRAAKELNIDVVAGCDFHEDMLKRFVESCPDALVTDDEDEFLAQDFDAVLIATYCPDHAKHAIKALRAGKHVLSEVTAFFTPAQGVELVETVETTGKVYNLAENYPFTKENMYLAKLYREG